jgi:hypothetical protein
MLRRALFGALEKRLGRAANHHGWGASDLLLTNQVKELMM